MAAVVGAAVLGRTVMLSKCANLRRLEVMDNSNLALVAFGSPRVLLIPAAKVSSSSPAFLQRSFHSNPRISSFGSSTTGATMIANSTQVRRSPQLDRYLNPRPWNGRRLLSTSPMAVAGAGAGAGAGSGSPGLVAFLVQLLEKIIQFLASLLPGKALVEKVEAEVDAAAGIIEEGARVVSEIADKVEGLAHAAELGADEVERIAQKVEDVTKKIQTIVDDVANVLEGEKGASTLLQTVEQLRKVAAAKRAQEKVPADAINMIEAVPDEKSEATKRTASSEEK